MTCCSVIFNIMHQAISSHGMLFDMKAEDLLKENGEMESTQSTRLGIWQVPAESIYIYIFFQVYIPIHDTRRGPWCFLRGWMADLTKHSSWISAALYSTVFADALRPQMIWCFSWPWMYISQLLLLHNQCGLLVLFGYLHLTLQKGRQTDSQTQIEPLICCWGTISKQQFVAFHLLSQTFFVYSVCA